MTACLFVGWSLLEFDKTRFKDPESLMMKGGANQFLEIGYGALRSFKEL